MSGDSYFKINNSALNLSIAGMRFKVANMSFERMGFSIRAHSHGKAGYELHYIDDGEGTLIADGKTFHISKGSLFMTGPDVMHEQIMNPHNHIVEFCVFFQFLSTDGCAPGDEKSMSEAFVNTPFWFGCERRIFPNIIKNISRELKQRQLGYIDNIRGELSRAVVEMVRFYTSGAKAEDEIYRISIDDNRLQMIELLFFWHYRDLDLSYMATSLGISPRQTEREIKKYFNMTFIQKLTQARLNAAAKFLSLPDNTIEEIATLTGFGSVEYFCYVFKKYFNVSPVKYRGEHKK